MRVRPRTFASLSLKLWDGAAPSMWLVLGRGRTDTGEAERAGRGDCSRGGKLALCPCPQFPGKAEPLKCCQIPACDQMWYFMGLLEDLISRW